MFENGLNVSDLSVPPQDRPLPTSSPAPFQFARLQSSGFPAEPEQTMDQLFSPERKMRTLPRSSAEKYMNPHRGRFGALGSRFDLERGVSEIYQVNNANVSNLECLNRPLGFMLYSAFSLWNRALSLSAISSNIERVTSSRSCHLRGKCL